MLKTVTKANLSFQKYHFRLLWMALCLWVPIFVDCAKVTHLWGSKFVAVAFSSIFNTENCFFVGTRFRGSDPPRKPRKLVPTKIKPSTVFLFHFYHWHIFTIFEFSQTIIWHVEEEEVFHFWILYSREHNSFFVCTQQNHEFFWDMSKFSLSAYLMFHSIRKSLRFKIPIYLSTWSMHAVMSVQKCKVTMTLVCCAKPKLGPFLPFITPFLGKVT